MTTLLRNGSKGDEVRSLQEKLTRLGYALEPDGHFGPTTEKTVRELQRVFGYTVDGIVGDGTTRLIDQQINYGWNATAPDAEEHGLRAQGKAHEADALRARREASTDKNAPTPASSMGQKPSASAPMSAAPQSEPAMQGGNASKHAAPASKQAPPGKQAAPTKS